MKLLTSLLKPIKKMILFTSLVGAIAGLSNTTLLWILNNLISNKHLADTKIAYVRTSLNSISNFSFSDHLIQSIRSR